MSVKYTPFNSVAFVPARGGSKGIKDKNIYPVRDIPLIGYTLSALELSVDAIYVSSDSDKILSVSGNLCPEARLLKRSEELSGDTTTTDAVLVDFIASGLASGELSEETTIVLAQPTSPLRSTRHVQESLALYKDSRPELLMSVVEAEKPPHQAFYVNDGYLDSVIPDSNPFKPRQSFKPAYYPNGAIYIFNVKDFTKDNSFPKSHIKPYVMSAEDSLDIDYIKDMECFETVLKCRENA